MSTPFRIIVSDGLAAEGLAKLKTLPNVALQEFSKIEREELKKILPEADMLIVRSATTVDRELLEVARNLKVVIRAGIGLDNVDIPAATDRGVVVMNAPTGNIVTTAEHTLALLFTITRHVAEADASMRLGKWEKKKFQGNEIRGKKLGLVGLGNIGKAVAERALGLGMQVIGYDPYLSKEVAAKHNIKLIGMDDVLREADYLSVHVPLTPATKHLIDATAFKKMKKGAYLINCARGGIVDETALLEALKSGHLNGAALDVFETEPLPSSSPLLKEPRLVVTPHLGASTDEAQVFVSLEVAEQVGQYLKDGVLKNAINVPNVSLEQLSFLKPYIELCERLAGFAAQAKTVTDVKKLRIRYEGAITTYNKEIMTLSVLRGFLQPLLSTPVNFVNARNLLNQRGIKIEEALAADCPDYASLVEISVEGSESITVAGTLFGKDEPRIVKIDNYAIDAVPTGCLLFTRNHDQPGVIGAMGTTLGTGGVNIARMHLGRDPQKREAIALINIDSEPSEPVIQKLKSLPGMISVKHIRLS